MRKTIWAVLAASTVIAATSAMAAVTNEGLIETYKAQGYTRIEIKRGLSQTKVEAIRGNEKIEVIYATETGAILETETEMVDGDDDVAPGIESRNVDKDFVGPGSDDDHDDDDKDDSDDDDHDNDNDDNDRDDDDD